MGEIKFPDIGPGPFVADPPIRWIPQEFTLNSASDLNEDEILHSSLPTQTMFLTNSETGHLLEAWWEGEDFYFRDTVDGSQTVLKKAYLSSVKFGNIEHDNESVTLVGNNKIWEQNEKES